MGKIFLLIPVLLIAMAALAYTRSRQIEFRRLKRKWNNDITEEKSRAERAHRDLWKNISLTAFALAAFVVWLRFVLH